MAKGTSRTVVAAVASAVAVEETWELWAPDVLLNLGDPELRRALRAADVEPAGDPRLGPVVRALFRARTDRRPWSIAEWRELRASKPLSVLPPQPIRGRGNPGRPDLRRAVWELVEALPKPAPSQGRSRHKCRAFQAAADLLNAADVEFDDTRAGKRWNYFAVQSHWSRHSVSQQTRVN